SDLRGPDCSTAARAGSHRRGRSPAQVAVLAVAVVLLIRHPGPDHLTGVGEVVVHRVVDDLRHAFEVAAVRGLVLLDRRPAPFPLGAHRGPCAAEGSGQAFQDGHALTIASTWET